MNKNYQKYKIFLFDLDHTLFRVNTSFRFGFYLYKQRVLPLSKMVYLLVCYGLHVLGQLSIRSLHFKTMKVLFKGKSIHDLNHLVESFLEENFLLLQNETVLGILRDAQSQGKYIAILSSSPDFLVQAIANRLNVDHYFATQYLLDSQGVIHGLSNSVQGEEKAAYVRSLVKSGDYSEQDIVAFSDSIHDLPFLESVGVPIAVNPDCSLYRLSQKNGWQIL